jgi:hypothetical protein
LQIAMVFPRRRRGNRLRRGVGNRGRNGGRRKYLKVRFYGGKVSARRNPTSKVSEPWNTLNLQYRHDLDDSSDAALHVEEVCKYIRSQNGLSETTKIDVRFMDVHVTDLCGRGIILVPCDREGQFYQEITDFPGRASWASAKFVWPASDQANSWSSETNPKSQIFHIVTGVTSISTFSKKSVLIQMTVLWKLTGVSAGPLVHNVMNRNQHIVGNFDVQVPRLISSPALDNALVVSNDQEEKNDIDLTK